MLVDIARQAVEIGYAMNEEITFGQVVKERRNVLGLTQTELARRVGCAAITIRKIEANDLRPSVQMAELIAIAFNVPNEEQPAFVRLARAARPLSPIPTPSPAPGEIGMTDLSGRAVRGFQLGEKIGSGGFGVVYRAIQPSIERDVAVKIILPRYANHPNFIRRFEAEATLGGHDIGAFETVKDGYRATCKRCGQTSWVGQNGLRHSLLMDTCPGPFLRTLLTSMPH